jgi:hypothetical protein
MRKSSFLLLALAVAGCGSSQVQQQTDAQTLEMYGSNVGKDYWIKGVVSFCQEPSLVGGNCTPLGGTSPYRIEHVKIDGVERGPASSAYYHVTLDDGRRGYIMTTYLMASGTDIDPVECKRRGDPRIGMTAKQVETTCWGKPKHVNRTETAGAISDQYVYDNDRYVYLRNGIVTSIQATGTLR